MAEYKDLNQELTHHNQKMRMELSDYRKELIKVRQDLLKQREDQVVLKNSVTIEILKMSQSFNVIMKILDSSDNEAINNTIMRVSNSLEKISRNSSNYNNMPSGIVDEEEHSGLDVEASIDSSDNDNTTNSVVVNERPANRRDNIGIASDISRNSYSIYDTSVSNFSFEVPNDDESTVKKSCDMNISANTSSEEDCSNNESSATNFETSNMSIIQEENESMTNACDKSLLQGNETVCPSIVESSRTENVLTVTMKITPTKCSTPYVRKLSTEIIPSSKIPIKKCSIPLNTPNNDSSIDSDVTLRSPLKEITSINNTTEVRSSMQKRKLPKRNAAPLNLAEQSCGSTDQTINSIMSDESDYIDENTIDETLKNERVNSNTTISEPTDMNISMNTSSTEVRRTQNHSNIPLRKCSVLLQTIKIESFAENKLTNDSSMEIKKESPARKLPRRKAAPTNLIERNVRSKLRRK